MANHRPNQEIENQMRGIHFGSQVTHLEESTKTNHPLNRTPVKTHKVNGNGIGLTEE
jgi:hypothetical protein